MSYRTAVATTDGKVVNEHFGRAKKFHIFEIYDNNEFTYLESRGVESCCKAGEHEDSAFDRVAETLQDCTAIIVAKIGYGASTYMESKGFEIYEAPFLITDALRKMIEYRNSEVG